VVARRRILAVTGGRADWSLLVPPLTLIKQSNEFDLKLAVTGQHLYESGKASLAEIEESGFTIDEAIPILDGDDSALGITRAVARATEGIGRVIDHHRPHLLFILGDRYEILAAAQAAVIARCPIAHLGGGDITEGAVDDVIRHAITKMAHLHFVTNELSVRRVVQMGEDESRVFNVGSTAIDRMLSLQIMSRNEFFELIKFAPQRRNLLVTFHPVTLEGDSLNQCHELLAALDLFETDVGIIFTGVNADVDGQKIQAAINFFTQSRKHTLIVPSLGSRGYYSALSYTNVVVGNSSSGFYEAPSFKIPTVNIGNRQTGRIRAASVIDCLPERESIRRAIEKAFSLDCSKVENPYGDGHASERIIAILKGLEDPSYLLQKRFSPMPSDSTL
jgi:UDP-hydrolysing UDP-N-acetyl-D-glucosamine 2-epimerase